jgi:flagellin
LIGPVQNDYSLFMARMMLQRNALEEANALTRLATGRAINTAADNPAGLIASVSFDSSLAEIDAQNDIDVRASNQAAVADAGLGSVSDLLIQAKSLVSANAGNTLSDSEKQANQVELDSILSSVDRLSNTTDFDGRELLDGTATISSSDDAVAIGSAASNAIGKVTINSTNYSLADLGSGKSLNIVTGDVSGAGQSLDQAINDISTMRGQIGGFTQGTIASQASLTKSKIALTSAVSMIRDTDYALELSRRIRAKILMAAGNFALGFAGAEPGGMISLFG